jgi:predicted ATPase
MLEGVASLVKKHLLRQEEGVKGEPRFMLLETIHEYAREWLELSGEATDLRRRHAECCLALAEEAVWLAWLEREHDNLRAALRWAQESRRSLA